MAVTAQELVVIGRGELVRQSMTEEFIREATDSTVRVRGPQPKRLRAILRDAGFTVRDDQDVLIVSGATSEQVGELAATKGAILHELSPQHGSLEQAFLRITGGYVDYRTQLDDLRRAG